MKKKQKNTRRARSKTVDADKNQLTEQELKILTRCERTIRRGKKVFLATGEALAIINDQRLYRYTHATFVEYCRDRLGISAKHAYGFVTSFQVAQELFGAADKHHLRPEQMSHLLALKGLAPGLLNEVMRVATQKAESAGRTLTAKDLRFARQQVEGAGRNNAPDNKPEKTNPPPANISIVDPHSILTLVERAQTRLAHGATEDLGAILDRIHDAMAAWITALEKEAEETPPQELMPKRQSGLTTL